MRNEDVQAGSELAQGEGVTAHDLADHGIHGHGLLEIIVVHQRQLVKRHSGRKHGFLNLILTQDQEGLVELVEKATFYAFALEAQVTHGFKKDVLLSVAAGAVSHFEQRVVGVIEQRLQCVLELLGSLVANLQQHNR